MTIAQEMFAIAPALGKANLTPAQASLLEGKARWIAAIAELGLPTVPTICITRAAWTALQAERHRAENRLRAHWVATLFRLVERSAQPPPLVVRTSAATHSAGLMPARPGIAAPHTVAESVDPTRPLGRAIAEAFESFSPEGAGRDRQLVIVQASVTSEPRAFLTRDAQTGALGPAALQGGPLPRLPQETTALALAQL